MVKPYFSVVKQMDTKRVQDASMNDESLTEILQTYSEAIEKLDGNVPEPCVQVYQTQVNMIEFCMKLHAAFM